MGLRLSAKRRSWQRAVIEAATQRPGIVPVVKGNGYGFGRAELMPIAAGLGPQIAVGTVYEALDVPADRTPVVLTPHLGPLPDTLHRSSVLTISNHHHVQALRDSRWAGSVTVKLESSMHRYGVSTDGLDPLLVAISESDCLVDAFALHFPLSGDPQQHLQQVHQWLPHLDPSIAVSLSHLSPAQYLELREAHPGRAFRLRCGTSLWHADKSLLWLSANVLDTAPVTRGVAVGYRGNPSPGTGQLIMIAAGSAHGVHLLSDGRSPFHFARQRLTLIESPHMHTSMAFVGGDQPCPQPGDRVDVQHPLTQTTIDELVWTDD